MMLVVLGGASNTGCISLPALEKPKPFIQTSAGEDCVDELNAERTHEPCTTGTVYPCEPQNTMKTATPLKFDPRIRPSTAGNVNENPSMSLALDPEPPKRNP